MLKTGFLLLCSFLSLSIFSQQPYTTVAADSKIHFTIKNFAIKTGGDFTGLKGAINFDPANLNNSNFAVTVDAMTIDTDNGMRDDHLKEDDYFDVAKYPVIGFKSTKIAKSKKDGIFIMYGQLTIKDVTKAIQFPFTATATDNGYLFEGSFEINRLDYKVGSKSISLQDKAEISLKVWAKK